MTKELSLEEYTEYLNKFSVLDIGIKGKIKKGKDFNGNYIYISNTEKFILTPPEYINYYEFKKEFKIKNELLRKINLCIKNTVLSNNITNENEKLYKQYQSQLQELLDKEEIINDYIKASTLELKNDIKKLQQESNICKNELQTIYENKTSLYKNDFDEWSKQNKLYLKTMQKLNKINKSLNKKEKFVDDKIETDNIMIKHPSIEFNPQKYNIDTIIT